MHNRGEEITLIGGTEENIGCAGEVWRTLSDMAESFFKAIGTVLSTINKVITTCAGYVWRAAVWLVDNVFIPVAMTGINVIGYLIDKFLFGSPGLRSYLHDGLIASEIPDSWREYVRTNSGWDIYNTMHPVLNNFFGLLGGGIGVLNILNHLLTSIRYNIPNYSHLLGSNGVFGDRNVTEDKRNIVVKAVFGFLTLPIVLPPLLVTNAIDVICGFIKHCSLSFYHNIRSTFNLLGEYGVMGARRKHADARSLTAKIFYGIISAPLVIISAIFTNITDGICAFTKHLFLSFGRNLRTTFNLLGENGVMGPRIAHKDERGLPAKIVYGVLSAPLVFPVALVTNVTDAFCSFVKHFCLSFARNLRRTFNLLGENGVMGPRRPYEDDRGLAAKIIYGILSAPFVAAAALVTNTVDCLCALPKNIGLSFWRNLRCTFNLFGKYGVMGERRAYEDERRLPARIIYGVLSAPLVMPAILVTNIVDAFCAVTKNLFLSFGRNLRPTFNLLGENGVMGARRQYEDDRGLLCKIIYGSLTAPFVFMAAVVTNVVDALCAFTKHLCISFWRNLRSTYNLLGRAGVMGARKPYEDDRGLPARIAYGVLSGLFVLPVATVSNIIDGLFTIIHHTSLSFYFNLTAYFNLLGAHGVMGQRRPNGDPRKMPLKIIFGIASAPVVVPLLLVTNVVDAFCSFIKDFFLSFGRILRSTFNLLGEYGVMGPRRPYADDRSLLIKFIFAHVAIPIVIPFALVTNLVDAVATFTKHLFLSFGRNLRSTFNILLGEYGVMGGRRAYADDRGMPAKIIYGILSAPLVLPAAIVTNIVDVFSSFTSHLFLSFGRNLRSTFNLLGEYGVMGPRRAHADDRGLPAKIIYGILSLPLLVPTALVSNIVDAFCSFTRHLFLSFGRNLRSTFNLLGEYGVMGPRKPHEDDRGLPAKIVYGSLTSPLVFAVAAVTNVTNVVCTLIRNTWLSFWNNLRSSFNLLGHYGVMGERKPYKDDRGMLAKIAYGIISAPLVFAAAAVTNIIDGVCAYFKNYEYTIKKPALLLTGLTVGTALALPVFALRKAVKGLYNLTLRPILDCVKSRPFNCTRIVKGAANVATLGGFSALKKVFKACTGYTDRFGFMPAPQKTWSNRDSAPFLADVFNQVQNRFRDAINLAAKGKFPGVPDGQGHFRVLMRVFYGMRNAVEGVVKAIHEAYLQYADSLDGRSIDRTDERYGMHSFFQSREYRQTREGVQSHLRDDEAAMLNSVEEYLLPAKP